MTCSWLVDCTLEGLYTGACAFEKATIVSEIPVHSNHALKMRGLNSKWRLLLAEKELSRVSLLSRISIGN